MKYQFIVTLNLKLGNSITKKEAENYIRNAVQDYKGCYNPEGPEFQLHHSQFTVKPVKR